MWDENRILQEMESYGVEPAIEIAPKSKLQAQLLAIRTKDAEYLKLSDKEKKAVLVGKQRTRLLPGFGKVLVLSALSEEDGMPVVVRHGAGA